MKTREHRVMDLLVKRLEQHLVTKSGAVFVPSSNPGAANSISISGSFTGAYAREFHLEITEIGKVQVTETTLFADMGTDAPEPYNQEISYTDGVSFSLAGTGLNVAILETALVGYEYSVRMGNAYESIYAISLHPINYDNNELPTPQISVYSAGNSNEYIPGEKIRSQSDISIVLSISPEQAERGDHFEILGDIRDCISRDPHLWDNTTCLADDVKYTGDSYFDQSDRGNSIFIAAIQITYESRTKNTRTI